MINPELNKIGKEVLNAEQENNLYQRILKLPHTAGLVTGVGRWDAVILFCAKTVAEFNELL